MMKSRHILYIMFIVSTMLMVACGEDRTYQYVEKTQHNHWIHDLMLDEYLWADSLTDYTPTWKNYFAEPSAFLELLTKQSKNADTWSYVEIDSIDDDAHSNGYFLHYESYGLDFLLMTDPTGQTTKQVLRVITVYPDSPAEHAGLLRGDYICSYNGYKLTANNIKRLQRGPARTLQVCHMEADPEEGFYYWADTIEVQLEPSEYVEDVAFPVTTVTDVEDRRVGYLMCTRLVEWPIEQGDRRGNNPVYRDRLDAIIQQLKAASLDEMILDLRLCNYGTIEMAQRLASFVVSPSALGGTFVKTFWNERYTDNNITLPYDTSVPNLGLNRIYIITSDRTQGAAEWLIHALQHSMGTENVIIIGTETAGQNVMTQEVGHDFYVSLNPVVAYVSDGSGDYDYAPIVPSIYENEFTYLNLYEYGIAEEVLFNTALQHMFGMRQIDSTEEDESDSLSE